MSKAKDVVKTAINPFWSASEKGGKKATEAVVESMTPDMPNMDEGGPAPSFHPLASWAVKWISARKIS